MKTNDDLMVHLIGILIEPVDVSNMLFVNPTIDITHLAVVIPVMSNMLQLASWNFNGKYEVSFLHGEVVVPNIHFPTYKRTFEVGYESITTYNEICKF